MVANRNSSSGAGAKENMKITNLATIVAVAALSGAAATSSAQSNGPLGLSARVGIFLPTNNSDIGNSTWFNFGLDYKINRYSVSAPTEGTQSYLGLSADYYFSGSNSNIPVALTYNVRSGQLVYSAGIGADFYNLDDINKTGTGLGGQIGVAYEFGHPQADRPDKPLFVQAKYFITRRSELSGFGLYVGYRF